MRRLFIWTKSDTNWKKLKDCSEPGNERGEKNQAQYLSQPLLNKTFQLFTENWYEIPTAIRDEGSFILLIVWAKTMESLLIRAS